jgi:hypothetical protein
MKPRRRRRGRENSGRDGIGALREPSQAAIIVPIEQEINDLKFAGVNLGRSMPRHLAIDLRFDPDIRMFPATELRRSVHETAVFRRSQCFANRAERPADDIGQTAVVDHVVTTAVALQRARISHDYHFAPRFRLRHNARR